MVLWCLLMTVACSALATSDSSDLFRMEAFLCNGRLILMEGNGRRQAPAKYLSTVLDYYENNATKDFHLWTGCQRLNPYTGRLIYRKTNFLGRFFSAYIMKLCRFAKVSINRVRWFAENFHPYNLFKVSTTTDDDFLEFSFDGCFMTVNGSEVSGVTYNYTTKLVVYQTVNLYKRRDVDHEVCDKYINFLMENRQIYSPFHGHPIIYIPGLISSPIYGQYQSDKDRNHEMSGGKQLWFPKASVVFGEGVKYVFGSQDFGKSLNYLKRIVNDDGTSNNYGNLTTKVLLWGHPDSVKGFETKRFHTVTTHLMNQGYVPGISLRAAPYDFRIAPNEQENFLEIFKLLVEETYKMNYNRRVVLLAHSMGNMFTLYFLNRQSQEWKDKYLKTFICMGAPWGGSPSSLKFILRGEADNIENFRSYLVDVARSWTSLLFLLPHENFFNESYPIVQSPNRTYTVKNYDQLLADIGIRNMIPAYNKIKNLTSHMTPPNVEVYCIFGYGYKTDSSYRYTTDEDFPNGDGFEKEVEDGDGVVPVRSAIGCSRWEGQQVQPVHTTGYEVKHPDLLTDLSLIAYLKTILFDSS